MADPFAMNLAPLLFAYALCAQTSTPHSITVPRGGAAELTLRVEHPQPGDIIDLLMDQTDGELHIFLPDGREQTDSEPQPGTFSMTAITPEQIAHHALKDALIRGMGTHVILAFMEEPQSGNFRFRIDGGRAALHFSAAFILGLDLGKASLRARGATINGPVKLSASGSAALRFDLPKTADESLLDIAVGNATVEVTLRFPDGTIVTRENAVAHGIEWGPTSWPPDLRGDDSFGFSTLVLSAGLLPVPGSHIMVSFTNGVRAAGRYLIELKAAPGTQADVTAMFGKVDSLFDVVDSFKTPKP
jgi:hypothetical protein